MTAIWSGKALLPSGWANRVRIAVANGRISTIETDVPAGADDECHGIAIPGLSNVHSHAFQRGMAGLAEHRGGSDDNFWSWRDCWRLPSTAQLSRRAMYATNKRPVMKKR